MDGHLAEATHEQVPANSFYQGQLVEVRRSDEICLTLDEDGKLDGMPFMQEMLQYCGRRFRVARRADRTCVEGFPQMRQMSSTVFLENLRCNGSAHDGCQRSCLIFWKEAWLKPIDTDHSPVPGSNVAIEQSALFSNFPTRCGDKFVCQSTELHVATSPISRSNISLFVRDVRYGELSVFGFLKFLIRMIVNAVLVVLHRPKLGVLAGNHRKNPKGDLNLQPGERIEVLSAKEIAGTLDPDGTNSGLTFEPEMMSYCGRQFVVDQVVAKIIQEKNGKMRAITNTVVLKGIVCRGACTANCPRANPLFFREIWLRRLQKETAREENGYLKPISTEPVEAV